MLFIRGNPGEINMNKNDNNNNPLFDITLNLNQVTVIYCLTFKELIPTGWSYKMALAECATFYDAYHPDVTQVIIDMAIEYSSDMETYYEVINKYKAA
tara:strand:+ start:1307 stop:1600 length:294 start_codon:yes stop_codon:yes gene_type:complete